jgi:hypothetical protein
VSRVPSSLFWLTAAQLQVKLVDLFLLPLELADDLLATWNLVLALKSEGLVKVRSGRRSIRAIADASPERGRLPLRHE